MNAQDLKKLEGRRVELRFHDGHKVRCRLVDVDPDSPGRELVYDELEVVEWGAVSPGTINLSDAASAALTDVADVKVLTG